MFDLSVVTTFGAMGAAALFYQAKVDKKELPADSKKKALKKIMVALSAVYVLSLYYQYNAGVFSRYSTNEINLGILMNHVIFAGFYFSCAAICLFLLRRIPFNKLRNIGMRLFSVCALGIFLFFMTGYWNQLTSACRENLMSINIHPTYPEYLFNVTPLYCVPKEIYDDRSRVRRFAEGWVRSVQHHNLEKEVGYPLRDIMSGEEYPLNAAEYRSQERH